jgi:hypothetical protein
MSRRPGAVFWSEAILATLAGCLGLLTLVWPDWIEGVFGADPDHGDGSVEWLVVAVCLALALTCSALARRRWLRAAPAGG